MNDSTWTIIRTTVEAEFSDLTDTASITRLLVRLMMALALGGILGYERERSGTSAGLRTHMLLALGAALFVYVPLEYGFEPEQLSRVLQGLVSGVGFLGAGAILKLSSKEEIRGLTTAGSLFMTAAIGMAVGMGRETTAIVSTVLALIILSAVRRLKKEPS